MIDAIVRFIAEDPKETVISWLIRYTIIIVCIALVSYYVCFSLENIELGMAIMFFGMSLYILMFARLLFND